MYEGVLLMRDLAWFTDVLDKNPDEREKMKLIVNYAETSGPITLAYLQLRFGKAILQRRWVGLTVDICAIPTVIAAVNGAACVRLTSGTLDGAVSALRQAAAEASARRAALLPS